MTLRERFEEVEIIFESQLLKLKQDEFCETPDDCIKIAEGFAIGFARWCMDNNQQVILNDGKYLLEIYKKEKGL